MVNSFEKYAKNEMYFQLPEHFYCKYGMALPTKVRTVAEEDYDIECDMLGR